MIPKVIHFCWFSDEEYPDLIKRCMLSWKRNLPDYKIKKWDADSFDFDSVPFVKEAIKNRKWAFAADYIRLYALYEEGGIYLDSDVLVRKSFDEFLTLPGFSAIEYNKKEYISKSRGKLVDKDGQLIDKEIDKIPGLEIQAAIIAADKGNKYIKDCLEFYKGRHFVLPDGSFFDKLILPDIMAFVARSYGFKYVDTKQNLDNNFILFPSEILSPHPFVSTNNSYAIHCCTGSWRSRIWLYKKIIDLRKKFWMWRNM